MPQEKKVFQNEYLLIIPLWIRNLKHTFRISQLVQLLKLVLMLSLLSHQQLLLRAQHLLVHCPHHPGTGERGARHRGRPRTL